MGTMPIVNGLTRDTIRIRVTAIPREGSDIGKKTHGIIVVVINIIPGSSAKGREKTYETKDLCRGCVESLVTAQIRSGGGAGS